ncbi:hypothetical protein GW17_00056462 [Ensete ventricosum]|nr:hypothetical protein GW17_00056462 [Ensete ventricosum]
MSFYSECYRSFIPDIFIAFITYHIVIPLHHACRPCGETCTYKANSGTNPGDLAERVNSGTNPGDSVEGANSGTNPGDFCREKNSGTNPGDLAKRVNSGTNPGDFAERVNSGTNPGDLAERANSGTNPWDSAEMMHSGTNPGDLAEDAFGLKSRGSGREDAFGLKSRGSGREDVLEHKSRGSGREDALGLKSRGSGREGTYLGGFWGGGALVVSSPGSGEASRCDPEVSSSGASSRPPSLIDARVLRDLEVMKADHDLDTAVTEGSLAVIRERYSIPVEYGLHVPQPGQRPYSSDAPDMCISVDALEASLRFPPHPLIEECLRWWRISPSHVAPNSWRYLVVFLGECQGAEIIPTWDLFMFGGSDFTGQHIRSVMPPRTYPRRNPSWSVSGGKAPPTRIVAREVDASPTREAPKALSKRPVDAPTEQTDDSARRHKKVKVLTRRHKSRHGEGESRSRSKDKEPAAPSEEPDTPVESEGGASPVHHRPRSMKDLFKMKVHKDDAGPRSVHPSCKRSSRRPDGSNMKRSYKYGYRVALARFHARHLDAEVEEDPFTIHPEDNLVPMERQKAFDDLVSPEP